MIREKPVVVRCPECDFQQSAVVEIPNPPTELMPFPIYVHVCQRCGYTITESEWAEVNNGHEGNAGPGSGNQGDAVPSEKDTEGDDTDLWIDHGEPVGSDGNPITF